MRVVGLAIPVVLAACSFRSPPAASGDAAIDGPGDEPTDASIDASIDAAIDAAPGPGRMKRITIDPMRVTGAQSQFPVWIRLVDGDLSARALASGADIHFTAAGGAALPYQIQRWDKATGRLEAWVRADLNDNAPTVLQLRYGDPNRTNPPSPAMVFASSFAAVWHLEDPLTTTAIAEATGVRPGTSSGLSAAKQVPSQLGGGVDFDGNNDRIAFDNPYTGGGSHTFSAWINQGTSTDCDSIVTVGTAQQNRSRWFHSHFVNGANAGVAAGFYANDWLGPITDVEGGGWLLLHWVFDGGTRQSRVYRNGVEVGSFTFNMGVDTQGAEGNIGYAPPGWGGCSLNGTLDEVRLATAARSAGWIATEHANQSAPQTFYTVGNEEPVP